MRFFIFCPDCINREGKLILSCHLGRTVRHWDVSAQGNVSRRHRSLELFEKMTAISSVTVSACAKLVVAASVDGIVQKWDTSTGDAVGPPMLGVGKSVAISKDGNEDWNLMGLMVVSCAPARYYLSIWLKEQSRCIIRIIT